MKFVDVNRYHPKLNLPHWQYKNKDMTRLEDFPTDAYGFVYTLHLKKDHKWYFYIGKKCLYQECNMCKLRSGKERKGHINFFQMRRNGHLVVMERIRKESNWQDYTGSADDISFYKLEKRMINYIAYNSLELTYLEARAIMIADAVRKKNFLNNNVLGKFYASNLRKVE